MNDALSGLSGALQNSGLNGQEAIIYEVLLQYGSLKAGQIIEKTPFKRGLVYKILEGMVQSGVVVEKHDPGTVARFEPAHPLKLKDLIEQRLEKAKDSKNMLAGIFPSLVSAYNLKLKRPALLFFEGLDGIKEIAEDSLTATTEILSYIDNDAIQKLIPDYNKEYVKKRNQLKIKKRMLCVDSESTRERARSFNTETTEVRILKSPVHFSTIMQIYNNKVTYVTLDDANTAISVILEDAHIYQMHKIIFESYWESAQKL